MAVNQAKVRKIVLINWLHTSVVFFVTTILMIIAVGLSVRFGGAKVIIRILMTGVAMTGFLFLISEVVITSLMKAHKPDQSRHQRFIGDIRDLCHDVGRFWQPKPRLYILEMGVPNACAFGLGFFGQYAIGITQELYDLLSPQELKAVLAHELAHIRCRDVGLMTLLVLITGGGEELSKLFLGGKTSLGKGPFAFIIGYGLYVVAKLIFPLGRSVISQLRELSADALSALYTGSAESLKSALRKLAATRPQHDRHFLDDLFISHPSVEQRIENLNHCSLN